MEAESAEESGPAVKVCYNYSCKKQAYVALGQAEWDDVRELFEPRAAIPMLERETIREAIGLMEEMVGRYLPVHRDKGRNPITRTWPGQMDCIDESLNITQYLELFAASGLLRWHAVKSRAFRAPYFFDQHWAGQIVEIGSGQYYVVDSWHLDNGNKPYIQELDKWLRKAAFDNSATTAYDRQH
jgi:hypothetical protein